MTNYEEIKMRNNLEGLDNQMFNAKNQEEYQFIKKLREAYVEEMEKKGVEVS